MGATIGGMFGALTGIAILGVIIASFFMMIGAKLAGIKDDTFGKSVIAAMGSEFVIWLISLVVPVLGFIIGLIIAVFVIKGIYETSFGKAFVAWIFCVIAEVIAIAKGTMTFATALL